MKKRKFEIEDRRNRDSRFSFGGRVVLWEIIEAPLPHKLYSGDFATPIEAERQRKRLALTTAQ